MKRRANPGDRNIALSSHQPPSTVSVGNRTSSESVRIGPSGSLSGGQTAYDFGLGFWLGLVGGVPKFSIGDSDGDKLTWDGDSLDITGNITADSGTIGGFTIGATSITAPNFTLDSSGQRITLGSSNDVVILDADDATYRLWIGNATAASAPFSVTKAGAISATSGTVGGFTLGSSTLTATNMTLDSSGQRITLGSSNDVVILDADDATYRLWIGHATAASAPFRVEKDGGLIASDATITGALTASALTVTSGDVLCSGSTQIVMNTSDGSDNQTLRMSGGGTVSTDRGAQLSLYGNEHAGGLGGLALLASGNVAGASAQISTGDNQAAITLNHGGATVIKSNGTITWSGDPTHSGNHTFSGGVTVTAAAGNVRSGTYTPTLTNTTNISGSTAYTAHFMRVGDVVTVSGRVDIDVTAAGSAVLGISLPVPSDFSGGSSNQLAGTAHAASVAEGGAISADETNNRAQMLVVAVDLSGQPWLFTFTYLVVN